MIAPAPEYHHVLCTLVSGDINTYTYLLRLICCIQVVNGSIQLRCSFSISVSLFGRLRHNW